MLLSQINCRAPRGARGLKSEAPLHVVAVPQVVPRAARGLKCRQVELDRERLKRRAPRGARGLKSRGWAILPHYRQSCPARCAWIEIRKNLNVLSLETWSCSARGAWIEMAALRKLPTRCAVSCPARGTWIEIPRRSDDHNRGTWIESICTELAQAGCRGGSALSAGEDGLRASDFGHWLAMTCVGRMGADSTGGGR